MSGFEPPEHLVILRTDHWVLNHRVDAVLPGYLMLGARMPTNDLSLMGAEALAELGVLLARAQSGLSAILKPEHLSIGRYGHVAGYPLHFHIMPICGWVKHRFFADPRYRVLQNFHRPSDADAVGHTDGGELTLYVWRELCANPDLAPIPGPTIQEVIGKLKDFMSVSDSGDSVA